MQRLTDISRILVGSLFIVSGMVKVVDPLGFSYKLDEYFTVFQEYFGFGEIFSPMALFLSMFMSVLEIVLGATLLLGAYPLITSWLILLLIVFFTFLTGFSAITDTVKDCGCFGDALKLTAWESFYKDVVLLVFTVIIFANRNSIEINTQKQDRWYILISLALIAGFSIFMINWPMPIWFAAIVLVLGAATKFILPRTQAHLPITALAALLTFGLNYYCLAHLPVKDFRPYAVGKNLPDQMEIPEGAPVDVWEVYYTLKHEDTGEEMRISATEYLEKKIWEDKKWVINPDLTEEILVFEGYKAKITDFSIMDIAGNDLTDAVLQHEAPVLWVVMYDLNKTNKKHFDKINQLVEACSANGMEVMALTGSLENDIEKFRHDVQAAFTFHSSDGTALKTIIRSNPGIVLLEKGTVKGKWHHNDTPTLEEVKASLK